MTAPNSRLRWTEDEQRFLVENYKALGPTKISQKLGRSIRAVTNHANELRRVRIVQFGPTSPGRPPLDI